METPPGRSGAIPICGCLRRATALAFRPRFDAKPGRFAGNHRIVRDRVMQIAATHPRSLQTNKAGRAQKWAGGGRKENDSHRTCGTFPYRIRRRHRRAHDGLFDRAGGPPRAWARRRAVIATVKHQPIKLETIFTASVSAGETQTRRRGAYESGRSFAHRVYLARRRGGRRSPLGNHYRPKWHKVLIEGLRQGFRG